MSDVDLTAAGPGRYDLVLAGAPHTVTVPAALLADMGLTAVQEPLLVRRAAELMASRGVEPPAELDLTRLDTLSPGWRELVLASL